jgi:hypothetical protein
LSCYAGVGRNKDRFSNDIRASWEVNDVARCLDHVSIANATRDIKLTARASVATIAAVSSVTCSKEN